MDGVDLATLLKNPSLCPALKSPERRLQLAIGITSGMCNLHHHRLPIVHGDFKASDVLVDAATLTPKAGSIAAASNIYLPSFILTIRGSSSSFQALILWEFSAILS